MNSIIANNLKAFREAARYTQEDVARALGITRSAYSNYESGDRETPLDVLEKISNLFGCDMYVLFEENENVEAMILSSAFRLEGLTDSDGVEIMRFKDIVKSYLKMEAIESK
ncbi:MAG: helix-turn-helix transcriptional regulator [Bacteroidales bacterium]|nr:helix-turn-helix transcriptional regulator [Bacteroidales bacterium]